MTTDQTSSSRSIYPRQVIQDLAGHREPKLVFVLQPINPAFDRVLAAIKAVGEAKALTIRRADDIKEPGAIMSQVVEEMCKAEIVIADLTDQNANVFYEMGIGHAIREDMILLTQDVDSVPFDLRHLRLIQYKKNRLAQLQRDLIGAIEEVLALQPEVRGIRLAAAADSVKIDEILGHRNLADLSREDFGSNADSDQLAVRDRDCTVPCRAFVLLCLVPTRSHNIDTEELWQWIDRQRLGADEMSPVFGRDMRPRGDAIMLRQEAWRKDNQGQLARYTLIEESGYLEWGRALGGCLEDLCVVRLTPLLAAARRLLQLRLQLRQDFGRPNDTLVVSIPHAGGTALSHLGKGWMEPWDKSMSHVAPRCADPHIQLRFQTPNDEADLLPLLKALDLKINRCYGAHRMTGFNHPDFGDPDELNPQFVTRDPWE